MSHAVHRFEVTPAPGHADPRADALKRDAHAIGIPLAGSRTSQIYLIEAALKPDQARAIGEQLLADPVTEAVRPGATPPAKGAQLVEVHPLPGVMDPVAQSVQMAIRELVGVDARVSTGWRYDLDGIDSAGADTLANRLLANPVIQRIHRASFVPEAFPSVTPHEHAVREIPIIGLTDDQLTRLSREAHLFLSLDEMRAVRDHYAAIGREPRDIELETLAQTWSEHCVHKTLKSTVVYRSDGATEGRSDGGGGGGGGAGGDVIKWAGRPGHVVNPDGSVTINNLLKSTVAAATFELIKEGIDWTLSVFVDNAGIIAFDDTTAVCVKVETHNHPSAIEPYGGAATGIGGCIRDIIGTGLGALPIASTDVFCVAPPTAEFVPPGCLHPRRVLTQVVAGVRDYGNRMGIPTVSGAVFFDDRYIGNPLVYCGCIGVMPRDRIKGVVQRGDLIVALGGRTGRDGIHGATFSSAELEQSSSDEFAHAVQIGNAIEEKRVLDAIIRARGGPSSPCLFSAITDCGAGGFSSAVGEMGKETGATVHLERAPLKYEGLAYTEIWISEAQERMVLAVPQANLAALQQICTEESVELAVLGTFGAETPGDATTEPELALLYHGKEVGRMSMHLLHDGIPTPHRDASWSRRTPAPAPRTSEPATDAALLALLAHPNIASKHWIIRQYDHEVKGATVIKPLVGPALSGPGDASVVRPVAGSPRGLAVSQGLQTGMGDPAIGGDPYLMTLAAVDECVRNLVCVGADPDRIAILDNFCWPSCTKPENLGSLVRAAEGCYDAAKAYRTPFVSGKDSLNNQFTIPASGDAPARTIEIPPTLLITGIGIVPDVATCTTMDAKGPSIAGGPTVLLLVGVTTDAMGGSHYQALFKSIGDGSPEVPHTDLVAGPRTARAVAAAIRDGKVLAAHDVSDGGLLCAVAEMLIAGSTPARSIGASMDLADVHANPSAAAFSESPTRYVLEIREKDLPGVRSALGPVPSTVVARINNTGKLTLGNATLPVESLRQAWTNTLDW